MKRQIPGFTLIELLIVITVLGILAAIAIPNYTQYVQRSRRNECEGAILAAANSLERRFSTSGSYNNGASTTSLPGPASCPADGGTATYNLSVVTNATTFTISAAPTGPQTGDPCGTLTYTNAGVKGQAAGKSVTECWH